MKILKRLLKIVFFLLFALCVLIGLWCLPFCSTAIRSLRENGCASDEERVKKYVKKVTDIDIPDGAKLLYEYEEENTDVLPVPGRKEEYFVFQFDSEPTEWLRENAFSAKKSVDYENDFLYYGFGLLELSMAEEIPEEYMPDLENTYLWLETQQIYFTYFPDKAMLIIFVQPS